MPDSLQDLFDKDQEAHAFFQSLPMFVQDHIKRHSRSIQTKEELGAIAHDAAREGLQLGQYAPLFEDETDSHIDLH